MAFYLAFFFSVLLLEVLILQSNGASAIPAFEEDRITSLPGAPNAGFRMYSGYITIDEDHGKALFYWFVEAEVSPETKPLTLWLNGGPGCSSVGVGALAELGPFFTNRAANGLIPNYHSWNHESNVIFLESPIGTGFSYSNTSSDYVMGDKQTAIDARKFLLKWLLKFPHYQGRDFYITGESYGGHYVPTLAKHIWDNIETNDPYIPFKGFAVGNPWTDPPVDYRGEVDFWYTRALISVEAYQNLTQNCGVKDYWEDVPGSACLDYLTEAYADMGDINIYDVYVDMCHPSAVIPQIKTLLDMKHKNIRRKLAKKSQTFRSSGAAVTFPWEYDPCIHFEVETYLNRPDVQRALHANVTNLPYPWSECSVVLQYFEEDSIGSVLPIYRELLKTPLQITIFSGDVDSAIPTMGTRRWIRQLEQEGHLQKTEMWRAWYLDEQVGGYTEEYNGGKFKFVTVRNAGHMVPYMQPARALEVFKAFIHNNSMPGPPAGFTSQTGFKAQLQSETGKTTSRRLKLKLKRAG